MLKSFYYFGGFPSRLLIFSQSKLDKAWDDTTFKVITWDSKFSESMVVYVPVQTTNGFRYLYYTARNSDLGINANPTYVHHGLGANQKNGAWHTTARDLEADLKEFEPNNDIISVNGI